MRRGFPVRDFHFDLPKQIHDLLRLVSLHGHERSSSKWILSHFTWYKKTGQVIGDELNLQPDPFGLVEAATELVKMGFKVFPYCIEDWILCRRLMDVGCEVLMPWAAPIGSGQGPRNFRALQELRERTLGIPLIVDAGIGLPSQACQVMEWGFDGILLNTAVSRSIDPVSMAGAFANAVRAGRGAFLAGPMVVQEAAVCSTPDIGRPFAQLSTRATRKLK